MKPNSNSASRISEARCRELKRLDRTRTGLLVAAGALTIGVLIESWLGRARDGEVPGEFEIPEARRGLLQVRIPR